MACRFCARRRRASSDLQVFTRSWLAPPKLRAICLRENISGATTAFACHPVPRLDPASVELFRGDTPSRHRLSCGWQARMRSGTLSESIIVPCVSHWWIFLRVPSAEVLPRESPKDVRSLGRIQFQWKVR